MGDANEAVESIREARRALRAARDALGDEALREAVWRGYAMRLSDAEVALDGINEIVCASQEER